MGLTQLFYKSGLLLETPVCGILNLLKTRHAARIWLASTCEFTIIVNPKGLPDPALTNVAMGSYRKTASRRS
jgi:hypothetical protein